MISLPMVDLSLPIVWAMAAFEEPLVMPVRIMRLSSKVKCEKELFYIMSRGFELKEAMKLMVRAKFNKVLATIKNEEIRNEIIAEMNNRLD